MTSLILSIHLFIIGTLISNKLNTNEVPLTIDNDSEIETMKNESKTINNIQTKINKALKNKIDNLETKITNTEIKETPDGTKDMLMIITLLKDENKILSKEIKMLNERLDRIEHSGQTESNAMPLILE